MKDRFGAAEKNFLTCAILMLVCGIALLFLGKTTVGLIAIALGVVFLLCILFMILIGKKENSDFKKGKHKSQKKDK